MGILKHDQILELHAAAVTSLAESREALLSGIPAAFVASLPGASSPADRILRDLGALNDVGELADGTVPLALWLRNALALAGGRMEAAVFRQALEQCPGASHGQAAGIGSAAALRATTLSLGHALARSATIGIITTRPVELAAMRAMLDGAFTCRFGGEESPYLVAEIPSRKGRSQAVVLALAAAGGAGAEACAAQMLKRFPRVDVLLMVGIAYPSGEPRG